MQGQFSSNCIRIITNIIPQIQSVQLKNGVCTTWQWDFLRYFTQFSDFSSKRWIQMYCNWINCWWSYAATLRVSMCINMKLMYIKKTRLTELCISVHYTSILINMKNSWTLTRCNSIYFCVTLRKTVLIFNPFMNCCWIIIYQKIIHAYSNHRLVKQQLNYVCFYTLQYIIHFLKKWRINGQNI